MIAGLLAERAADPLGADRVFLRTAETELTYAEAEARVATLAGGLRRLGVRRGEPVIAVMDNRIELVLLWFALARLGAVHVPVNPALVGDGLAHPFRLTRAHRAVVDRAFLAALAGVRDRLRDLDTVLVTESPDVARLLRDGDGAGVRDVDPLDDAVMLFTSGTTGVAKACVLSHRYVLRQGQLHARALGLTADDVLYCPFPLFHIDAATLTVVAALAVGGTAAIGRRYSTSRFWHEVRAFDATVFNFMGATLTMLWQAPPDRGDRDHRVRLAWGVPMPLWRKGFEDRFGVRLLEVYGLTDGGVPVYDPLDAPHRNGFCGRVIDAYEVAIAAPDGTPLLPGQIGEILVRGREPGLVMNRYFGMPEATERALRDGWVHTGDLGALTEDGYLTFLGRSGEVIRRRGENISAPEVEAVLLAHPEVAEAAAVGVPSDLAEDEVMAFVVLRDRDRCGARELTDWMAGRIAPHMVPRFVEFLEALPRTPTQKIAKAALRERGRGAGTWDREGHRPDR